MELEKPELHVINGTEYWISGFFFHREDGPAIISLNAKEWYFNGKRHREDGPAIEYLQNQATDKWYYHGKNVDCSTQQQFEKIMKLKAFW